MRLLLGLCECVRDSVCVCVYVGKENLKQQYKTRHQAVMCH